LDQILQVISCIQSTPGAARRRESANEAPAIVSIRWREFPMMKFRLLGTTVLAAAFTLPALAQAPQQTAQAQSGQNRAQLEEITVTAERREASLQSVPVAVSAFNVQALENRQITQAADLQRVVPSLKMTNNITTPNNLSPSLRGSTVQDASLVVAESPFGIYVDDVYVGRLNNNNPELADIERVEVLRGPQGTLYGRNTLAGAIKFISRTPGEDQWLNASAGYGSYGRYKLSGSVGGPLSDAFAASIAAQANGLGGYYNNVGNGDDDWGRERNYAVRGKVRYMGTENFDAILSLSYTRSKNDALPLVPFSTPSVAANRQFTSDQIVPFINRDPYTIRVPANTGAAASDPFKPLPKGDTKQFIGSATLSYDFGGAVVKSITAYQTLKDDWYNNFAGGAPVLNISGANTSDTKQFTQEFQVTGKAFDDRFNYILGAYYLHENADQQLSWQLGLGPAGSMVNFSRDPIASKVRSIAVYGQGDYKITDKLKATLGLRWLRDKKEFTAQSFSYFGAPPSRIVSLDRRYSAVTPRFGLDYELASGGVIDSMLLYANVSRGFKSGGFSGILVGNINDANAYNPEKNWTYEAGVKTDLLDNRLRLNANYFINRVNDVQLNATAPRPDGTFGFPVQNAGDTTIKGLELEISAVPIEGLNIYANAAFMSGKFRSLSPGSQAAIARTAFNVANPEPPQVPDSSFSIGFDYGVDFSLGQSDARFSFGADWFRSSSYTLASAQDFIVSPYSRINAFVALGLNDQWEVRGSVKNLADKATFISGSRSLGGGIILPPREFMVTLSYKM
jgi:iron complex outermembrane receptor protein